ncbi:MAG TPA: type II secretion system protein [Phycisphaerae bacterium]|nr:type II secretion system protein [Phycisphaerae bacterium]
MLSATANVRGRERRKDRRAGRAGFTLIELLVVVAIIIALVALLIPALSAAKRRARYVDNQNLLTSIEQAVEQYQQVFNAYPSAPDGTSTGASSNKMSGAQALLLALSYAWVDNSGTNGNPPNDVNTVFGTTASPPLASYASSTLSITVDPAKPTGPIDHGNTTPTGAFRAYAAFFTASSRELAPSYTSTSGPPAWHGSGVTLRGPVVSANSFNFPVLIDHYGDPLPILYFRGTPGITGTVTVTAGNTSQSNPALVGEDTTATFNRWDNVEYLQTQSMAVDNIASTNASDHTFATPDQSYWSPLSPGYQGKLTSNPTPNGGDPVRTDLNFAKLLTGAGSTAGTYSGPSNFVLMSAGEDRIYGTADDIIIKR